MRKNASYKVMTILFMATLALMATLAVAQENEGQLKIKTLVHAGVQLQYQGKVLYVDPIEGYDYKNAPKADIILLTHHHSDHFDKAGIAAVSKDKTVFVGPKEVTKILGSGKTLGNGEFLQWQGIRILAVPAYNLVGKRGNGEPFHPKGRDNGYLISFGKDNVYIAGDTELIPEMNDLAGKVKFAIMPISKPYTMDEKACVQAAKIIKPQTLIPYHYFEADPELVRNGLEGSGIEVIIAKKK